MNKQEQLDAFVLACKEAGQRMTPQKKHLYRLLCKNHTHPTAQELYTQAKNQFPHISFATVYKNLSCFVDLGLIREVHMGGSVRYDTNMGEHHHVINQQTGEIQDVDIYGDIPVPAGISRDKIKRIKITYYV